MNKNIGMTLILILSLIILLYYTNRISRERFENSEDLYRMGISNEKFGKFCQKLKLLDKPNEYNNILNKMRKETSKKNEDIIGELLEEINKVQKGIIENDIDIKNKYKLYTHNKADKQEKVIKTALDNVKNKDKLFVNLV